MQEGGATVESCPGRLSKQDGSFTGDGDAERDLEAGGAIRRQLLAMSSKRLADASLTAMDEAGPSGSSLSTTMSVGRGWFGRGCSRGVEAGNSHPSRCAATVGSPGWGRSAGCVEGASAAAHIMMGGRTAKTADKLKRLMRRTERTVCGKHSLLWIGNQTNGLRFARSVILLGVSVLVWGGRRNTEFSLHFVRPLRLALFPSVQRLRQAEKTASMLACRVSLAHSHWAMRPPGRRRGAAHAGPLAYVAACRKARAC